MSFRCDLPRCCRFEKLWKVLRRHRTSTRTAPLQGLETRDQAFCVNGNATRGADPEFSCRKAFRQQIRQSTCGPTRWNVAGMKLSSSAGSKNKPRIQRKKRGSLPKHRSKSASARIGAGFPASLLHAPARMPRPQEDLRLLSKDITVNKLTSQTALLHHLRWQAALAHDPARSDSPSAQVVSVIGPDVRSIRDLRAVCSTHRSLTDFHREGCTVRKVEVVYCEMIGGSVALSSPLARSQSLIDDCATSRKQFV